MSDKKIKVDIEMEEIQKEMDRLIKIKNESLMEVGLKVVGDLPSCYIENCKNLWVAFKAGQNYGRCERLYEELIEKMNK